MKICKSKKSLRMHLVFKYCPECQEKYDPEGVVSETNDLPRTLNIYIYIISTITTELTELQLREFFCGIPLSRNVLFFFFHAPPR